MHVPWASVAETIALYLRDLLLLQTYHLYDRVSRGDASLGFALHHWSMWMGLPTWCGSEAARLEQHRSEVRAAFCVELPEIHPGRAALEDRAQTTLKRLRPTLDRLLCGLQYMPTQTWFGCFRYTLEREGGLAALHFYNCACPRSPFEDQDALRDDLRQCLLAIRREAPGVTCVQCGSWINNLASFRALFPDPYVDSLVITDPNGKSGLGWWGQFVASDGQLNESRAEELRATGRFHYDRLLGRCGLAEALSYLG